MAATTEDLSQLLAGGNGGRIELSGDRYQLGTLTFSGVDVTLVGRGPRTTVLEGPVRMDTCTGCALQGVTVIVGDGASAIIEVNGGALSLRDVRIGEASDHTEVGILTRNATLDLDRAWLQTGSVGVRDSGGSRLAVRHSIFQELAHGVEVADDTDVTLVDNLFSGIEGCVVLGSGAAARPPSLNAMFGNVRVPSPPSDAPERSCQEDVLLRPTDPDAAPVLLELRRSEALADSPALSLSGPR